VPSVIWESRNSQPDLRLGNILTAEVGVPVHPAR